MTANDIIQMILKSKDIKLSDKVVFELEDGTTFEILPDWQYHKEDNTVLIHLY